MIFSFALRLPHIFIVGVCNMLRPFLSLSRRHLEEHDAQVIFFSDGTGSGTGSVGGGPEHHESRPADTTGADCHWPWHCHWSNWPTILLVVWGSAALLFILLGACLVRLCRKRAAGRSEWVDTTSARFTMGKDSLLDALLNGEGVHKSTTRKNGANQ